MAMQGKKLSLRDKIAQQLAAQGLNYIPEIPQKPVEKETVPPPQSKVDFDVDKVLEQGGVDAALPEHKSDEEHASNLLSTLGLKIGGKPLAKVRTEEGATVVPQARKRIFRRKNG